MASAIWPEHDSLEQQAQFTIVLFVQMMQSTRSKNLTRCYIGSVAVSCYSMCFTFLVMRYWLYLVACTAINKYQWMQCPLCLNRTLVLFTSYTYHPLLWVDKPRPANSPLLEELTATSVFLFLALGLTSVRGTHFSLGSGPQSVKQWHESNWSEP